MSTLEYQSALKIQDAYRRHQARSQLKNKVDWEINEKLEYSEEQRSEILRDMFKKLLQASDSLSPGLAEALRKLQSPADDAELSRSTSQRGIHVGSGYNGPRIDGPLTPKVLVDLIQAFKRGQTLHEKYVFGVLHQAREALRTLTNYNHVQLASLGHVTVVGDLHGQLADLLHIFSHNGLPSTDNAYIFNGDFVDRGPNSIEVLLLLLVALILYPSSVFLNRGNHEDFTVNARYGFTNEVKKKYPACAQQLLDLLKDLFSWLPLYSIIETGIYKIIVMHGGISHEIRLSTLKNLPRNHYFSMEVEPISKTGMKGLTSEEAAEYHQFQDLLWSDPDPNRGSSGYRASKRGIGYFFGGDITEQFLKKYQLSMIIRSHEVKPDGYEYRHGGKILTVFSASNYERYDNAGAVIRWEYNNREPRIFQHRIPRGAMERSNLNNQTAGSIDSTYQSLIQRIVENKRPLLAAFKQADWGQNGRVSLKDWESIMSNVLRMNIAWLTIRSKLVREDSQGVLYGTMFDQYTVNNSQMQTSNSHLVEDLYQWKDILWTLFNIIDRNHSGSINREEFADIVRILFYNQNTYDENLYARVDELTRAMDKDGNGKIDFNEFFEGFRLVHAR